MNRLLWSRHLTMVCAIWLGKKLISLGGWGEVWLSVFEVLFSKTILFFSDCVNRKWKTLPFLLCFHFTERGRVCVRERETGIESHLYLFFFSTKAEQKTQLLFTIYNMTILLQCNKLCIMWEHFTATKTAFLQMMHFKMRYMYNSFTVYAYSHLDQFEMMSVHPDGLVCFIA